MNSRTIAAVLTVLTLAACGGGGGGTEPATVGTTSTVTTPAATTGASEATVEQYASLVAKNEGAWRETVADVDDNCTDPDAVATCAANYITAGFQAEAFRIELSAAHDPECQANPQCSLYVGEVPTEIAGLVAITEAAAEDYVAAQQAWSATGCADPMDSACDAGEAFMMRLTLDRLIQQFDAWKPYTGG
jgi:hypothetical protein